MSPIHLFVVCLICMSGLSDADIQMKKVIWTTEGSRLETLTCPPLDNPNNSPLYKWDVEGYHEYELKNIFNLGPRGVNLTLKNQVNIDNQGVYTCTSINGHGARNFTYHVKVRAHDAKLFCTQGESLCFADPSKIIKRTDILSVTMGSEVELDCTAISRYNLPITYEWYRDQTLLVDYNEATLNLLQVTDHDSGSYRCSVLASSEHIDHRFQVRVQTPKYTNDYPKILTSFTDLVTKEGGNTTIIEADITCPCTDLFVQWFKRIETTAMEGQTLPGARPSERNELYYILDDTISPMIVIEKLEFIKVIDMFTQEKLFQARLKFIGPLNARIHAGKYAMLATNHGSVNSQMVYKTFNIQFVEQIAKQDRNNSTYYFLIPFLVFFLLLILVVYCLLLRRNRKSLMTSSPNVISGHWSLTANSDHQTFLKTNPHPGYNQHPPYTSNRGSQSFNGIMSPYSLLQANNTNSKNTNPGGGMSPINNNDTYYSNSSSSTQYKYPIPSSNNTQYNNKTLSTELPYEQEYAAITGNHNSLSKSIDNNDNNYCEGINQNPYSIPCYDVESNNNPFLSNDNVNKNKSIRYYMN